jgi:hypothetical protein
VLIVTFVLAYSTSLLRFKAIIVARNILGFIVHLALEQEQPRRRCLMSLTE